MLSGKHEVHQSLPTTLSFLDIHLEIHEFMVYQLISSSVRILNAHLVDISTLVKEIPACCIILNSEELPRQREKKNRTEKPQTTDTYPELSNPRK